MLEKKSYLSEVRILPECNIVAASRKKERKRERERAGGNDVV
jgi:hypothetical protein